MDKPSEIDEYVYQRLAKLRVHVIGMWVRIVDPSSSSVAILVLEEKNLVSAAQPSAA